MSNRFNGDDILGSHTLVCMSDGFAFAPKGLSLEAQGCRLGYLGKKAILGHPTAARLRPASKSWLTAATALRLKLSPAFPG